MHAVNISKMCRKITYVRIIHDENIPIKIILNSRKVRHVRIIYNGENIFHSIRHHKRIYCGRFDLL